jgi:hypothetical protein
LELDAANCWIRESMICMGDNLSLADAPMLTATAIIRAIRDYPSPNPKLRVPEFSGFYFSVRFSGAVF